MILFLLLLSLATAACSHDAELDALAAARMAKVDPNPDAAVSVPVVPIPVPPEPCVTVLGPAAGLRLGASGDVAPSTPQVQTALSLRVAPSCTATTLRAGLCQRDPTGLPVAPETWSLEMTVEPGREYGPVVTVPDALGTHLPCVYLDQIYAVAVDRVCEGAERACDSDRSCHDDTATNPMRCGDSCQICPPGDQGEPTCIAGKCGLKCAENYRFEAGGCHLRPGCKGSEAACRGDDCCALDLITEGPGQPLKIKRGYDASNSAESLPEFQPASSQAVTVAPFYMDRYEVTVARFRRFADAYESWRNAENPKPGHGAHPAVAASGWPEEWTRQGLIEGYAKPIYIVPPTRAEIVASVTKAACGAYTTWNETPGPNDDLPINCVNFWLAYFYCMWDGEATTSRLPTEAEWNAAAAGGDQQRAYPWSSPDYASRAIEGRAAFGAGDRLPFEVGASPSGAGRWGTQDLAGNVWEWVRDVGDKAISGSGSFRYVNDPSDPIDLTGEQDPERPHVLRGGSFKDFTCIDCEPQARLRTSAREVLPPYNSFNDTGIRCVRTYRP